MSWEAILHVLFWGATFGLVHTYFLYPLSLKFWSLVVANSEAELKDDLPSVALIIAAYNEEDVISEKIENSLNLEYPEELLDIIVFSDASSDRTDDIVEEYADQGVSLIRIEGRIGKTGCQNKVAEGVDADVLVFSDANSMYESTAITELIRRFEDGVGCVVGELKYNPSDDVEGESVYWTYESILKRLESRVYSLVTGNGAIYAVRAKSYEPLARDAISDFAEPLSIVRKGEVVKYAPEAIAWEDTEDSVSSELQRRIRIVTRSWHTVANNKSLLSPIQDATFAYELWSHKILRWLTPLLLFTALVSNLLLVHIGQWVLYQALLAGQLTFYLLALIGLIADRFDLDDPTITHAPYYFLYSSFGMLLGLANFLRGENIVVWDTSDRT